MFTLGTKERPIIATVILFSCNFYSAYLSTSHALSLWATQGGGMNKTHVCVCVAWDPSPWFNLQGLNWWRCGGTDSEVIMFLLFLCRGGEGGIKDYRRRAAAAPHGKQPAPDSFNVWVHLNFMLRRKWQDGPLNELHCHLWASSLCPLLKSLANLWSCT